jgi:hypothetical protein
VKEEEMKKRRMEDLMVSDAERPMAGAQVDALMFDSNLSVLRTFSFSLYRQP